MSYRSLAWGLVLALGAGCLLNSPQQVKDSGEPCAMTPGFRGRLLEVAHSYESFGRLDTKARRRPVVSGQVSFTFEYPRYEFPAPALSTSGDPDTHGQKLYSLFVKDLPERGGYLNSYTVEGEPSPVGQSVVMETWRPDEAKDGAPIQMPNKREVTVRGQVQTDWFAPYTYQGGKLYHAREKVGLFIMLKLKPGTPGTDEGWIYGTVTADGKQVMSVGRLESCMKCHQKAPHDRLFGLPKERE